MEPTKHNKSQSLRPRFDQHTHRRERLGYIWSWLRSSRWWLLFWFKSQIFLLFHSLTCSRFTRLFVRSSPCQKYLIHSYNPRVQGFKDIKNDILDCQRHKYTNTTYEKGSDITYIYLYFWKANDARTSKMIFWTVKHTNTQLQIHKYTNTKTQIHNYTVMKCRKYPTCAICSKSQGFKDIKNDILDFQKYKYRGDVMTKYLQIWNYEPLLTHWLTFALYHQVYYFYHHYHCHYWLLWWCFEQNAASLTLWKRAVVTWQHLIKFLISSLQPLTLALTTAAIACILNSISLILSSVFLISLFRHFSCLAFKSHC